jgi:hypothetical protein
MTLSVAGLSEAGFWCSAGVIDPSYNLAPFLASVFPGKIRRSLANYS